MKYYNMFSGSAGADGSVDVEESFVDPDAYLCVSYAWRAQQQTLQPSACTEPVYICCYKRLTVHPSAAYSWTH